MCWQQISFEDKYSIQASQIAAPSALNGPYETDDEIFEDRENQILKKLMDISYVKSAFKFD